MGAIGPNKAGRAGDQASWRLKRGGRVLAACVLSVLVCGPARSNPSPDAQPPKHVGFSILEDWEKGTDLAEVAKDFALFHELGVTTWRGSFSWNDLEPARGVFDFEWLQRFADLAAAYGITLRPYIAYTPAWAARAGPDGQAWNHPPAEAADWTEFVRALAGAMRRHHNIASYEIYNEENVAQWWSGNAADYSNALRRAAEVIRAVSPRTPVLMGGMVYADSRWLRAVCRDGHDAARFNAIAFHAYPETWTPPDVDLEHYLGPHFEDGFAAGADRDCGRKPIWINETGYATTNGHSEADQADWWARAIATFAAEPRVEEIGVYEIKDLSSDRPAIGDATNYHLGITHADRRKKLAFSTIQSLVPLMTGPLSIADADVFVSARASALDNVYHHAFTLADGHELVFVWTKGETVGVTIRVPHAGSAAIEHRLDGGIVEYAHFDGHELTNITLQPSHARVFEVLP